jgi:hypothetical protein
MFNTTQDFIKSATEFYTSVPKTPEKIKDAMEKVQTVYKTEFTNAQDMFKIYQKSTTGDATPKEIMSANSKATELLKATAFASLISIPGALFMLPSIINKAKEYNIDLVPKSVSAEFNI